MRQHLQRGTVAVALASAVFVGLTALAGAAEVPVAGSYDGSAQFEIIECSGAGLSGIGHTTVATGTIAPFGETQVSGVTCISAVFPELLGHFTFTGSGGSVSGDVTGFMEPAGPQYTWTEHITLAVTGGTGDFEGATGTLSLEGTFSLAMVTSGTLSGTITVPPDTPASKDECKNGGWRDHYDENGEPFKNQGACIAWVVHNT